MQICEFALCEFANAYQWSHSNVKLDCGSAQHCTYVVHCRTKWSESRYNSTLWYHDLTLWQQWCKFLYLCIFNFISKVTSYTDTLCWLHWLCSPLIFYFLSNDQEQCQGTFALCRVAECNKIRLCCAANAKNGVHVSVAWLWHDFSMPQHVGGMKIQLVKCRYHQKFAALIFAVNSSEV